MTHRRVPVAGKALAYLVVAPLLGAIGGSAYALVCGGVHWVIRGEGDRVLIFGGKCVAGGVVLGLVVAVCRVLYFAWTMAARPKAAQEPNQSRACSATSMSWSTIA